jgi:hypothetical protein
MESQVFGPQLSKVEVRIFKEILFNREAAIAFDFSEYSRFTRDVCPLYKIKTIEHKA